MKKKNRCADEFPSSSIRKYTGYPDSAYIHFDEVGAVLFIFRANPSLKELDGFEKKFEIRITEFSKIMFISFRFGSSDWCSISYSPYLDTWQSKQFIFPNCKYGINLFIALFDTSTGKILRARMLDLPCLFSKKYALPLYCRHCSHSIKRNILKLLSSLLFFIRKKKLQCKANYHHAAQSIIVHHRLSLYKNNELFSHHTFQNNQKNAESLFCVS